MVGSNKLCRVFERERTDDVLSFFVQVRSEKGMLMWHKVTQQQRPMTASTIPEIYFNFPIDFNFIYDILNIVKIDRKGELNWR